MIPDLKNRTILELGSGTGLVGLCCDKLGAPKVYLTDYHESVLKNVVINVELNQSSAAVSKLDFIQIAQHYQPPEKNSSNNDNNNTATALSSWEGHGKKFDIVIASDLLYEMEHAEYLPVAVEKLMENEFHFMIPLRSTHVAEVELFELRMTQVGLMKEQVSDTECEEEEGIVRYRYYKYIRALTTSTASSL